MRQNLGLKRFKGLTLLEMVISIAIFTLVATTIAIVFKSSLSVYQSASEENAAAQKGQVALGWLGRDISLASCIYEANPTSLGLKNPKFGYVGYYLQDSTLMRTDCAVDQTVCEDVTNFNLNYYDSSNQPTSVICDIKTIEITLSISLGDKTLDLYKVVAPESCCEECWWAKAYGLEGNERLTSLVQTSDGSYILGGYAWTSGGNGWEYLVVKVDTLGDISWSKTYGATSVGDERLYSLQQTSDGGYVMGGYTGSLGLLGSVAFLVIKIDSSGNLEWTKAYGGSGSDYLYSVQQTSDGGYILGGYTSSYGTLGEFLLIKTDTLGNVSWAKTYGGTAQDFAYNVQQTSDGGYILGGETRSFGAGGRDILLVKTDSSGDLSWARVYGGTEDEWCRVQDLKQTSDGGYIFATDTQSFDLGSNTSMVVKTDSSGDIIWAKVFGLPFRFSYIYSLEQTSDGFLLGGAIDYNLVGAATNAAFLSIITDNDGNVGAAYPGTWCRVYGGINTDYCYVFQQTPDGGYALAGYTYNFGAGYLAIRTDSQGNLDCCDIMEDFVPTITDPSVTTSPPSPTVTTPSPGVVIPSLTVTDVTPTVNITCPTPLP